MKDSFNPLFGLLSTWFFQGFHATYENAFRQEEKPCDMVRETVCMQPSHSQFTKLCSIENSQRDLFLEGCQSSQIELYVHQLITQPSMFVAPPQCTVSLHQACARTTVVLNHPQYYCAKRNPLQFHLPANSSYTILIQICGFNRKR